MALSHDTPTFDLVSMVNRLAMRRPVFHSEADLKFALAWEIQVALPACDIRLEFPIRIGHRRSYIDLFTMDPRRRKFAIELKYWTKRLNTVLDGEKFELQDQRRLTNNRRDFWKDAMRLEALVAEGVFDEGWMLGLTNNEAYWHEGSGTSEPAPRVHQGMHRVRRITPRHAGEPHTSAAQDASGAPALDYELNWRHYTQVEGIGATDFKFLLLKVRNHTGPSVGR